MKRGQAGGARRHAHLAKGQGLDRLAIDKKTLCDDATMAELRRISTAC